MPEIVADPPVASCYRLYSGEAIEESQQLAPDLFRPRARDARERFAKGSSGNLRGRPRGIPNPRRRVPDLPARPAERAGAADLLDRKPSAAAPRRATPAAARPRPYPPPLAGGGTVRHGAIEE